MRMDRYLDLNKNDSKLTRTNKNQELYTDVYLNNVYVDIDNLKEVMKEDDDNKETLKIEKENPVVTNYLYEDKNYDINEIVSLAIKNKKDDNLKRSLDIEVNNQELDNLIESINETQKEKEKLDNENLLSDLMPSNDNTTVIPPLEEPILDTSILDIELDNDKEISHDMLDDDITDKDLESDDSFLEKESSKIKIVLIVLVILLVICLVVGVLFFKDII